MPQSLSILMIDDNPADSEMVRRYLRSDTISVETRFVSAHSLDDALTKLSNDTFDLLFLDYNFPFGNGFDILERFRSEGYDPPTILLTGEGNEDVAGSAVKYRLYDYLPKRDLSPERLQQAINQVIEREETVPVEKTRSDYQRFFSRTDSLVGVIDQLSRFLQKNRPCVFVFYWVTNDDQAPPADFEHEFDESQDYCGQFKIRPGMFGVLFHDRHEPPDTERFLSFEGVKEAIIENCPRNMMSDYTDPAGLINELLDRVFTRDDLPECRIPPHQNAS